MRHPQEFFKKVNEAKLKISECTVDHIYEMNKNKSLDGILVDTREEFEFSKGYIPNSIHISKGTIESIIELVIPNKNQKIYLYCGAGLRSALVAETLKEMGYNDIISIAGGWKLWNAKGYPTFSPSDIIQVEFLKLVNIAKAKIKECSSIYLFDKIHSDTLDGIIIDVREDSEFNKFHIKEAIHLSKGQIEVKIENIVSNKEQKIYLYCSNGLRSALTAYSLQKMGYTCIFSVSMGIQDWLNNNYPIIQGGL